MKKIIVLLCLVLVFLIGCGKQPDHKKTVRQDAYALEENEGITTCYILNGEDNILHNFEMRTTVDLAVFDKDEAKSFTNACKDTEKTLKDKKFVEYAYSVTDDMLLESIKFNLVNYGAFNELRDQNVLEFKEDAMPSYDKTVETLEAKGYKKVDSQTLQ